MARFAFGNTLAAFSRTATSIVESTLSGSFDSTFVDNSILIPSGQIDYIQTMPFIDASSTTTLGMRFDFYAGNGTALIGDSLFQLINSSGVVVAKWVATDALTLNMQFKYWDGAAFQNKGTTTLLNVATRYNLTFNITAGVSGTLEIYKDNVLIASGSGMDADFNDIAAVRFYGLSGWGIYISQFQAADFDLRDSRYRQKLANGNGAYTDGSGTYTDINEVVLDDSTGIALPAVNNKKSFTHQAITVPSGYKIAATCVAMRGRVNGGVVSDADLLIRSGSTDSFSSGVGLTGGYEPRGYYTDTDPATAAAWTQSGFNAAEFGLKAV